MPTPTPAPLLVVPSSETARAHEPDPIVRRSFIAVVTRRDFIVAAGVGTLGLAGCGSSSTPTTPGTTPPPPPPPPAGLIPVTGMVALPNGSALSPGNLTINVVGQKVALSSTAGFAARVSPDAPTLAMVTDPGGNGVLAGFLDAALTGSQTITPRSTGVALAWFALGGPSLPGEVKSQVLAELTADPAMDTLGQVIAQRITGASLAIVNGDAQIAAALNSALDALLAGGSSLVRPAQLRLANDPTLALVPVTDQSGISVRPATQVVGVTISNSYRRPIKAYVYETQTETAGTTTNLVPARLVAGPFDLGLPTSFGTIEQLRAYLLDPTPFKAFTLSAIPLPLDGASDQTTYEVVVIGPSSKGVVPDFFSARRYAAQVGGWNSLISAMFARTFFCNLCYATLLEMTGFGSILETSPNLDVAAAATAQFAGNPFPGTPAVPPTKTLFLSQYNATMAQMLNEADLAGRYQAVAPTIMNSSTAQALQQVNSVNWRAGVNTASNFLLKLAGPLLGLKSGNVAKLFDDLNIADRGVLWTATVSKSSVTITPPNPSAAAGDQVALTVVLSSDLTSTYEFDWSQSSGTATLSAVGENNTGPSINTQRTTVNLITTDADAQPIVVQVAVFDIANGKRISIGTATATVAIVPKATITPIAPGLDVGEQQTFTVSVAIVLPAGVQYIWTLTGNSGSIGALNLVTTTVPTLQYTAIRKGTDTLSVQVVDKNNQLLAKGSTTVTVDPDAFIELVVSGTWDPSKAPPNGTYSYQDFLGGRSAPGSGEGTGDPTIDGLFFQFDNNPDAVGILLGMFVRAGAVFTAGQTFSLVPEGVVPSPGQFALLLDTNLSNPADPNSNQVRIQGTGTCKLDTLETLADGSFLADFSFTINNGNGGTVSATGVGTWK